MTDPIQVPKEDEIPRLSLSAMREVFPTKKGLVEAEQAVQPTLPSDRLKNLSNLQTPEGREIRSKQFQEFLVEQNRRDINRENQPPGSELTVAAGTLGAAAVTAPFLGPAVPLAMRMLAIGTAGGVTEQIIRQLQGESFTEALPKSIATSEIFAGAELLGPGAATAVGKSFGVTRDVVHSGGRAIRRLRGKQPQPDIPTITSTAAPFSKFLEIEGREVFETVTALGGTPQASQLVQHGLVDTAQKILNKSITAQQGQTAMKAFNIRLIVNAIKKTVNELPKMSRENVGHIIQDLASGRLAQVKGVAQGYYRQADKILGKTKKVKRTITEDIPKLDAARNPILNVNGKPLIETVSREITEIVPVHGVNIIPLKKQALKELKLLESGQRNNPQMERNLRNILDKPDTITYGSAQQIRTEFFETSKQLLLGAGDVAKASSRVATVLTIPLTKAMLSTASKAGPEAKRLITRADAIWADEVRGELTQTFVRKLVNGQADDVLDAIVAQGSPEQIRNIRKIVMASEGGIDAWAGIQGALLNRMVYANAEKRLVGNDVVINSFNGKGILDDLTRMAREDGAIIRELFPAGGTGSDTIRNFKKYIQALESTQRTISGEATGAVFIQLGQAAAVGTALGGLTMVFTGNAPASGLVGVLGLTGAYLLAPNMVGRMFKNNEIVRWMTVGAKHSPGTVPAVKAQIAILGLLVKNKILTGDQAEQAIQQTQSLIELLQGSPQ